MKYQKMHYWKHVQKPDWYAVIVKQRLTAFHTFLSKRGNKFMRSGKEI